VYLDIQEFEFEVAVCEALKAILVKSQGMNPQEGIEHIILVRSEMDKAVQNMRRLDASLKERGINIGYIKSKCIKMILIYHTKSSLLALRKLYESGELLDMLQEGLITKHVREVCHMESITLKVTISEEEFELCLSNAGTYKFYYFRVNMTTQLQN